MRAKTKKKAKKKTVKKKAVKKEETYGPTEVRTLHISFGVETAKEMEELNDEVRNIQEAMVSLATEAACGNRGTSATVRHILRLSKRVAQLRARWEIITAWDSPLISESELAELQAKAAIK